MVLNPFLSSTQERRTAHAPFQVGTTVSWETFRSRRAHPPTTLGSVLWPVPLFLTLALSACWDGPSPLGLSSENVAFEHAWAHTGSNGIATIPSLALTVRVTDEVTGQPLSNIAVTGVRRDRTLGLIVVDTKGYHLPRIVTPHELSAGSDAQIVDIELTQREGMSDIHFGAAHLSASLWPDVKRLFYDHYQVPLSATFDIVNVAVTEWLIETVVAEKLIIALFPLAPATSVFLGTVSLVKFGVLLWNLTVLEHYRSMGYADDQSFDVYVIKPAFTFLLNRKILLEPTEPPRFPIESRGTITISVRHSVTNELMFMPRIELAGPSTHVASPIREEAHFTDLIPGRYMISIHRQGFYPALLDVDLEPGGSERREVWLTPYGTGHGTLAIQAAGGTWHSRTAVITEGTTALVVFRNGNGTTGTVSIEGPPFWNSGRAWTFGTREIRTGSWMWNALYPSVPRTGSYVVRVVDQLNWTGETRFNVDASRTMEAPANVAVTAFDLRSVQTTWTPVTEARVYLVTVGDANDCDALGRCRSIADIFVAGHIHEARLSDVPFQSGGRYFIGIWAFDTNVLAEPPAVPEQFNVGYTPSRIFNMTGTAGTLVVEDTASTTEGSPGGHFLWSPLRLDDAARLLDRQE
jgi:hypothetical protein